MGAAVGDAVVRGTASGVPTGSGTISAIGAVDGFVPSPGLGISCGFPIETGFSAIDTDPCSMRSPNGVPAAVAATTSFAMGEATVVVAMTAARNHTETRIPKILANMQCSEDVFYGCEMGRKSSF